MVAIWGLGLCLAMVGLVPSAWGGTTYDWYPEFGSWAWPDNWRPIGTPTGEDLVKINQGGTVTINESGAICHDLSIGDTDHHGQVVMTAGSLTVVDDEFLGHDSWNGVFTQRAGAHTVGDLLLVGRNAEGEYYLHGGTLNTRREYIGEQALAKFHQHGGVHTVTNEMIIGKGSNSNGAYWITSGTLDVGGSIVKGQGTNGFILEGGSVTVGDAFNLDSFMSSGGSLSIGGGLTGRDFDWDADSLSVGANVDVTDGFNLWRGQVHIGGAITAGSFKFGAEPVNEMTFALAPGQVLKADSATIGKSGKSCFTIAGGTLRISGNVHLAEDEGSTASLRLESGTMDVTGSITGLGEGTFIMDGGQILLGGGGQLAVSNFYLGDAPGSDVTFENTYTRPVHANRMEIGRSGKGTFNHTAETNSVGEALYMGVNAAGRGTYILTVGAVLQAPNEYVGYAGIGSLNQGGTSSNTISQALSVGDQAGGVGTYTLTQGTLSAANEIVGKAGTGTFVQTGGSNTMTASLTVGDQATGSGSYTQNGATLEAQSAYIGNRGTGWMEVLGESSSTFHASVNVGVQAGGNGTFVLTNGTVRVEGSLTIGQNDGSNGTFTQVSGTNQVLTGLYLGQNAGSTGSYALSGGSVSALVQAVGVSGAGTFTNTGGLNPVTTNLLLGFYAGGSGRYELSGAGNLHAAAEMVGVMGCGAIAQTGGSNTITGMLSLGSAPGSTGTYTLSGSSQVTLEAAAQVIGDGGDGLMEQTGGANAATQTLSIADKAGSRADYVLSAGTFWTDVEYVGNSGVGTFTQTGGIHSLTGNTGDMVIAQNAGSTGTFRFTGGKLYLMGAIRCGSGNSTLIMDGGTIIGGESVSVTNLYVGDGPGTVGVFNANERTVNADYEFIGKGSTGTMTLPKWGTNNVTHEFCLGVDGGSSGTYNQTGGSLQAGPEYIGLDGRGTFIHSAGFNNSGPMYIGTAYGSTGSYTLSGTGELDTADLHVGKSGTGTFSQSGSGSLAQVLWALYVGTNPGSSGTYNLDGGTLNADDGEYIGQAGAGTLNHTGGTNTAPSIRLGVQPGGNGTYSLTSGAGLSVGDLYVGCGGTGKFTQYGTTLSVSRNMVIGQNAGGVGTYSPVGGTLSVSGNLYVGLAGAGTVVQTAGRTTVGDSLYVGEQAGSVGSYKMTGSSPDLGANYEYIGLAGSGTFTQAGGTNVCTWVSIAQEPGSSGAYYLQGGTLAANIVDSNGTFSQTGGTLTTSELNASASAITTVSGTSAFYALTVTNNGSFVLSGGTLDGLAMIAGTVYNGGSFTQTGGIVNDGVMNYGTFTFSGGTFNSQFQNWGTAAINANFTAGDGLINYGTLDVAAGRRASGNGASGLDNYGTIVLHTGGTLGGTSVTNEPGAALRGNGTISAQFTNYGRIEPDGVLVASFGGINQGIISLGTNTGLRTNGMLTNRGTVELRGGSISGSPSVTNDGGLIHAISPCLMSLSNLSGGNINGGEIRIDAGSNLAINSSFVSSGTIVLAGAGSALSGGAVNNSGSISGLGRVANSVLNNGTIRAEGGTLTVAGTSCTNGTAGRVEVAAGSTAQFSQGIASNAGNISLLGGTFDNIARPMSSTGSISGWGTLRTGGLTNHGHVGVGGGNMDVFGSVSNASDGVIEVSGNSTVTFYSLASGPGNFPGAGKVVFLGGYSPGNSPGIIAFGGDVAFGSGGTLTMELAENNNTNPAMPRYDELNIAHNVSLSGFLDLDWTPRAGDPASKFGGTYDLITYGGQLTGTFSVRCDFSAYIQSLDYAADAGEGLKAVRLKLYPLVAGDADLNRVVDAADYIALKQNFGTGTSWEQGNFDGVGTTGWTDFQTLMTALSVGGSPPVTAPEPATIGLLAAGALAMLRRQRTRRAVA